MSATANVDGKKRTRAQIGKVRELFGPPPVLSTESERAYNEILSQFVESFAPQDVLELSLVRHLTDSTWEIIRYTRHKTLGIEARFRQHLLAEAQRKKLQAQRMQEIARKRAERSQTPANEDERLGELEKVVMTSVADVDEILDRVPKELDHARALEANIENHERLDGCLNASVSRRNDVLNQFELYRVGLSLRLRKLSDKIIDAEFSEVEKLKRESPPLMPADGGER
jgi:hypothetical protein